MVGRPKREEEVTPVLLRIPPALLKRVERCQALLQLREDTRFTRTEAFYRIIEAGCEAVEPQSKRHNASEPLATVKAQVPRSSTAVLPVHIQRIAETRAQYDKLSLAELSQLLYDRNIYKAKDRQSGEEKPVNRGTLQKWLEQAQEAGLL
jgi:hypothetical protein